MIHTKRRGRQGHHLQTAHYYSSAPPSSTDIANFTAYGFSCTVQQHRRSPRFSIECTATSLSEHLTKTAERAGRGQRSQNSIQRTYIRPNARWQSTQAHSSLKSSRTAPPDQQAARNSRLAERRAVPRKATTHTHRTINLLEVLPVVAATVGLVLWEHSIRLQEHKRYAS